MNKYAAENANAILTDLYYWFDKTNARVIRPREMQPGKIGPLVVEYFKSQLNITVNFSARPDGTVWGSIEYSAMGNQGEIQIPPFDTTAGVKSKFRLAMSELTNSLSRWSALKQVEVVQATKDANIAKMALDNASDFVNELPR